MPGPDSKSLWLIFRGARQPAQPLSPGVASVEQEGISFCLLDGALRKGRPKMFNTDQGAQFTIITSTDKLEANGVRINVDGRRRWLDNAGQRFAKAAVAQFGV